MLAVIVILGILILIAVPSITKYIDQAKKNTYVNTIKDMVDAVRYSVVSEDSMAGKKEKAFLLSQVKLEKGSGKTPYGKLIDENSYVLVSKTTDGYTYKVQVKDDGGYCIELTDVDKLDKSKVKKCDEISNIEIVPELRTYVIGDTVTFAGSNWYVIKNSTSDEDYVTLLKETVLTHDELGENYAITRDETEYDTMAYYWSDTCHWSGNYGYTDYDDSGCAGHNDYEGSKVKEYLEETYINTLGVDNLKEVDGYKVRLINYDELMGNLGYTMDMTSEGAGEYPSANDNVPTWVYQNFGYTDGSNEVYGYWTMTPHPDYSRNVWYVDSTGTLHSYPVYHYYGRGVRPVINLLKSSI